MTNNAEYGSIDIVPNRMNNDMSITDLHNDVRQLNYNNNT